MTPSKPDVQALMDDPYRKQLLDRADWVSANGGLRGVPAASHEALRVEVIKLAAALFALSGETETEVLWQYSYVEQWSDGSGVYDRMIFDDLDGAKQYLLNSAESLKDLNAEVFVYGDQAVANIERRRIYPPSDWEVVV